MQDRNYQTGNPEVSRGFGNLIRPLGGGSHRKRSYQTDEQVDDEWKYNFKLHSERGGR